MVKFWLNSYFELFYFSVEIIIINCQLNLQRETKWEIRALHINDAMASIPTAHHHSSGLWRSTQGPPIENVSRHALHASLPSCSYSARNERAVASTCHLSHRFGRIFGPTAISQPWQRNYLSFLISIFVSLFSLLALYSYFIVLRLHCITVFKTEAYYHLFALYTSLFITAESM